MQLSRRELLSALSSEKRPPSRIRSHQKVDPSTVYPRYADTIVQQTQMPLFASNDPVFGVEGIAKDARYMYLEAATAALNQVEKEDNSVALTIHKVIDFLLSDARLNLKEVEQYKGQVYYLERSNRELREQIWTLKNENAKNIEIVYIGVLRLYEYEDAIYSLSKYLFYQKQLNAHLDAMLKVEQQYRQARELDIVEARYRRDQIIKKNNEMTTDVVAIRTAYENALQDLREANEVARATREEIELLRKALDDKSALLALRDEQIKQMEARKNFYATEMKRENQKLQDALMMMVGFLNQLGMHLSESELFSPEVREIGDNLVYQLLAERSELAFYKKSNISKIKGHSISDTKALVSKGSRNGQQPTDGHSLHELMSLFQQQQVKTQIVKSDKAIYTARKIIGVSKSGLISADVFDDREIGRIYKLILELSDVDEKQIIEQYAHRSEELAEIQIKADKTLKYYIRRYFVSRDEYAKLASRKNKLGKTIANLLLYKKKAERLVGHLIAVLDETQRSDEHLSKMIADSGISLYLATGSFSEQEEITDAALVLNAGDDVYSENEYAEWLAKSENAEPEEYNTNETGKLTNTPYESRSLKSSGRPITGNANGNGFQGRPMMVTEEYQTTELQFVKCVCIKCGYFIGQRAIERILYNDEEEIRRSTLASYSQVYSANDEGNTKFLTTCAAVIRAERGQFTEQIYVLSNYYRLYQPGDDRLMAELCKHDEDLSECHELIMNALMYKSNGVRYVLQQENRVYNVKMTAAQELIVKSSTFYQSGQVVRYYPTFSRIRGGERLFHIKQGRNVLLAAYSELVLPLGIKTEAQPPDSDFAHRSISQTSKYAEPKDSGTEGCQFPLALAKKLQPIKEGDEKYHSLIDCPEAEQQDKAQKHKRYSLLPPRNRRPTAIEAIQTSLNPQMSSNEVLASIGIEHLILEKKVNPDETQEKLIPLENTLVSDIRSFLSSSNCDYGSLAQLSIELAKHSTFAHVVRQVKQLTAPGSVYRRAENGHFSNPFKEIVNIFAAKRSLDGKKIDGRALYQQVVNLYIKMLYARASRQIMHTATKERERSILLKSRAGVVFSASGQNQVGQTNSRQLNCAELRSVVGSELNLPAQALEIRWLEKSLKSAILNYCSDFIVQSPSLRLEARASGFFHTFCLYWQFLRNFRYINRQTLVCEPEIESTALPGVNSRVYYIIVVQQYQMPLERIAAETNAQIIERRGSLFVCVPFEVSIKPVGWIVGLIKYILSAIDVSAATYHCIPELVHYWAAYNYGLKHLVAMLEFHLLANLIFYQIEEPSVELFYLLYTKRLTSDYLEFFTFLYYAIPWNQPGSKEAGATIAHALFSGIGEQRMEQLNMALTYVCSVFETYLLLLRYFYVSRIELSSWIVDRFEGAYSIRFSEAEQLLHKLIPYAPREILYQRLSQLPQVTPGDILVLVFSVSFEGDEVMQHALNKVYAVDKLIGLSEQTDADFLNRLDMLRSSFYKLYHAGFALGAMQVANQVVSFFVFGRNNY